MASKVMNISSANREGHWRDGIDGRFKTSEAKENKFQAVLDKEVSKRKEIKDGCSHN